VEKRFEKFHPVELDLYFKYGPDVFGGDASAYFLKEAKDIQEVECLSTISACVSNPTPEIPPM
jgi:hypothetical protein